MKKLLLVYLTILLSLYSNFAWSDEYQTNPGFRDLNPGMSIKEWKTHCGGSTCYGIDNIKFFPKYNKLDHLWGIFLDMGPIVESDGSFFSVLNNLVIDEESNIYLQMKRNFDSKYILEYMFSERDRQLFNEDLKEDLLGVYSNGQVTIRINRKERENSYSKDLWLHIEYRDIEYGKQFLQRNRPVTATLDDF